MQRRGFIHTIIALITAMFAPFSIPKIKGKEVLIPTFEIASNPMIRLTEIKARRFYIVDRAMIKAKEEMQKEEDIRIFNEISDKLTTEEVA